MPRKTVSRFIPDIKDLLGRSPLGSSGRAIQNSNVMRINRRSVSLAVYVGIFCAFIPIPGQTVIALLICFSFGANLPIATIFIWISNPLTIPPMFYLTYQLGSKLLGTEPINFTISFSLEWLMALSTQVIFPLMVGSLLCGVIAATLGYLIVLQLWRWKVIQNWEKRREGRNNL